MNRWLEVTPGGAPLIISLPHTGVDIPDALVGRLVSPWLARKDADWWVDELYGFAKALGATLVRTRISRTVIDVNRDPTGKSLYPGQATTNLCPLETFDGEPLYRPGQEPGQAEIAQRIADWFEPYHASIASEIARLRQSFGHVVLYDAHAIRTCVPRLFEGRLPDLNIGTNDGRACSPDLAARIAAICAASPFTSVLDGRFKGGWTTRHYGRPGMGLHAIQMELACSAYLHEPDDASSDNWPAPFQSERAAALQSVLEQVLGAAIDFAADAVK